MIPVCVLPVGLQPEVRDAALTNLEEVRWVDCKCEHAAGWKFRQRSRGLDALDDRDVGDPVPALREMGRDGRLGSARHPHQHDVGLLPQPRVLAVVRLHGELHRGDALEVELVEAEAPSGAPLRLAPEYFGHGAEQRPEQVDGSHAVRGRLGVQLIPQLRVHQGVHQERTLRRRPLHDPDDLLPGARARKDPEPRAGVAKLHQGSPNHGLGGAARRVAHHEDRRAWGALVVRLVVHRPRAPAAPHRDCTAPGGFVRRAQSTLLPDPGHGMKFFIDSADIDEIREAYSMGVVDGVTTNPSLIAKTGRKFEEVLADICEIVDGPISAEAVSEKADDLIAEGRHLAGLHRNIVVKLPLTVEGLKACKALTDDDIQTNVTLCFSPAQALLAAKAGATYVSPFVGRLDDIGHTGMQLIEQCVQLYANYPALRTEVLVASIRSPGHVIEAGLIGADVATIPFKVIGQLAKHPLTDAGIERFLADWATVPKP